ncbi:MAG: PAS domain-containing protein [Planctomycetaceae bacterium]
MNSGSSIDDVVLSVLRPLSCYLSMLFLVLTVYYNYTLPPEAGMLVITASCTTMLTVIVWYMTTSTRFRKCCAHMKLSLCMLQILTLLTVSENYFQSAIVNVLNPLVMVGMGSLYLSRKWLLGTFGIYFLIFFCIQLDLSPGRLFDDHAVILLCSAAFSMFVNAIRMQSFRELNQIRAKEAEHKIELEHTLQDLKAREELFRMLGQSLPIGIFKTDDSGRCTFTNNRWQSISQIPFSEMVSAHWYDAIHESERQKAA